jgi:hypothetical protein
MEIGGLLTQLAGYGKPSSSWGKREISLDIAGFL